MAEPESGSPAPAAKADPETSSGLKGLYKNSAILYGAGTILLIAGLAGTVIAGYKTAMADGKVEEIEEEPEAEEAEEEIVEFSPEEYRPVPGIDLARERSPDAGHGERVIALSPAMVREPDVTRAASAVEIPPDTAHELIKPFDVRALSGDRIELSIATASADLSTSGGLGGVEPLRRKNAESRSVDSSGALVRVPSVAPPEARLPSAQPMPGSYSSTILPPREYNIDVAPRKQAYPERLDEGASRVPGTVQQ